MNNYTPLDWYRHYVFVDYREQKTAAAGGSERTINKEKEKLKLEDINLNLKKEISLLNQNSPKHASKINFGVSQYMNRNTSNSVVVQPNKLSCFQSQIINFGTEEQEIAPKFSSKINDDINNNNNNNANLARKLSDGTNKNSDQNKNVGNNNNSNQ